MKKLYIIVAAILNGAAAYSQCSVVVTQHNNVSCFGSCDGSAQVTTVGVPNFTYVWSPGGQTVQNPTTLCPGTHTVTMTDGNSCQATATVTITEPADISLSASFNNVTCNGSCNGQATITPSGGTTPYSYSWNDPQSSTTDTANGLCPGSYTCTVTDFNGCSKFTAVTITEPTAMVVTVSTTNATCHGACDGTTMASASGGSPGYTYAWSSGCNTASCNNLCAGSYTLTTTDANSCTHMDTVMISEPTQVMPNATSTNASCPSCSDGTASTAASGGTAPYTYMWSPGGQTTSSVTGLAPGTYVVCVTDANLCSDCDTVTVSALTGINEAGEDKSVTLFPNPASSYVWLSLNTTAFVQVNIRDLSGRTIYSEAYSAKAGTPEKIDLTGIPAGPYFITITSGDQTVTRKIIRY
ncbi:MAG TPA: T9SS type A sorting domain-containing protein [Bacteroidia bacterium]|nr:T9SS type A sorting domain-containing protein [Bacteroidia bacterium]